MTLNVNDHQMHNFDHGDTRHYIGAITYGDSTRWNAHLKQMTPTPGRHPGRSVRRNRIMKSATPAAPKSRPRPRRCRPVDPIPPPPARRPPTTPPTRSRRIDPRNCRSRRTSPSKPVPANIDRPRPRSAGATWGPEANRGLSNSIQVTRDTGLKRFPAFPPGPPEGTTGARRKRENAHPDGTIAVRAGIDAATSRTHILGAAGTPGRAATRSRSRPRPGPACRRSRCRPTSPRWSC